MKQTITLIIILLSAECFSQTPYKSYYSALRGLEDYNGKIHLYYTHFEAFRNPYYPSDNTSVTINQLDLSEKKDSLFLKGGYTCTLPYCTGRTILDFEFWDKDPSKFIYGGNNGGMDPNPFIERYDKKNSQAKGFVVSNIELSRKNDSILYYSSGPMLYRSSDNGISWTLTSEDFELHSLSPFNDYVLFGRSRQGNLVRSTDGGKTSTIVDTARSDYEDMYKFFFDKDSSFVYRIAGKSLYVSSKSGDPYTFRKTFTGSNKLLISVDTKRSGRLYIAEGRRILFSDDCGSSLKLFKTLERRIVGIYAKPGEDVVYAATRYNIFEVSPDSVKIIKTLKVTPDLLKYYPLAKGNKWIYSYLDWPAYSQAYSSEMVKEVMGDTLMPNGKKYFHIRQLEPYPSKTYSHLYERIDSATARIYRYSSSGDKTEQLIDDLSADFGDTVKSHRFNSREALATTLTMDDSIEKWNRTFYRKHFDHSYLFFWQYDFLYGIGISYMREGYDFGSITYTLKGCIVNGVSYGDTNLVGVEEKLSVVKGFRLDQNYPNPFNPSTVIKYQIPGPGFVSLKVYDALGNEIATLVSMEQSAGSHEVVFPNQGAKLDLPSGVYFYSLRTPGYSQTRKMLLIK